MPVWINEIHYDNSGADTQEGVEIAGTAGTDVTGWTIVPYNGNTPGAAVPYTPVGSLSGTIPDNGNGFGTIWINLVGLQNGPNDGLALVDGDGNVVQFISYEGVITAAAAPQGGPAAGMTSTDIGVSQGGTQSDAFTIQLQGSGGTYSDFTWSAGVAATRGTTNTGQTFVPAGPTLPSLSIDDVAMSEGDAGTVTYTFTVSLSAPAGPGGVTFDIATADGTATTADGDYVANSLTGQTIAQGDSTYQFTVTVNADTVIEPDESFFVNVTNVTGATVADGQGHGTITNDDLPPVPGASIADATVVEGQDGVSYLVFTVTLDFAAPGPVTIDYATADDTATAGSDYLAVGGTIAFEAGESVRTISVPIVGDARPEASETFTVTLSNPTGATLSDGQAVGTIANDDGPLYFALASGHFSQNWSNTGLITANDDWSGVPHIIGYLGDIDSGSPTGVDPRTLTGADLGAVDVIANQNTAGSSSGGVGEFQLANPTAGLQGSGTADAPSLVLYMDASGRQDIRFQANIRDIDGSGDNAVQQVAVQYRTDPNGSWTNVPGGYVADATTAGAADQVTPIDVVLPAGADNAATLQIRILTTNAAGSDEWVGIDDIVVSSELAPPSYSIDDAAVFEGTGGTTPISFTVTRAGDTSAAGTVDYAVTFPGGGFSASAADFTSPLAGTVGFGAGETTKTIVLDIAADAVPEADEGFTVTLSNPSGTVADGTATGTIVNDDGEPAFVTIADVVQNEGDAGTTTFTFTVARTGGTGAFTVDYQTVGGTALEGSDYAGTSGTLSFGAGEDSKTIEVVVNGDTAGELAETFTVQLSNPVGAVIADPEATGTIQNDDILFISQIQGTAYYSPILAGEGKNGFNVASTTTVVVQAVVTALDGVGSRQGFYLTEETGQWDANDLTSEGIFVMTRDDAGAGIDLATFAPGLQVGDLVTITAQVIEYQSFNTMPRTLLVNPTGLSIVSTGNPLPTLVLDASRPIPNAIMTAVTPDYTDSSGASGTFDAANYALSFWETVEGMLVTIPDMVVADGFVQTSGGQPYFQAYSAVHANADQINDRGGYTIAGDPPHSPPDTAETLDDVLRGGRHLHDGDVNPDIIEVDFSGFAMNAPAGLTQSLSMGDRLGDITGIVEFDFTDRKLYVTGIDPVDFVDTVPAREVTVLGTDHRSLTVATFNVENLDPGDGAARFAALADAIANNLNAPDIISIEEIQDNNGTTSDGTTDASLTWQMLVDALNAAVPGAAYQWVDQAPVNNAEGGAGGGNIRVGFLYNTNRVQLGDLPADATIEQRRQYTDRIGDGVRDAGDLIAFSDDMIAGEINPADWTNTRLSLLGQFTFNGNTVFVTANHFTAKGGSGEFWQFDQDLEAGEPENSGFDRRVQQANDVYAMMNLIKTGAPQAGVVAGGDFNDFYFYRPLEVLTGYVLPDGSARSGGTRFDNLTLTLSEAERYTYTFDGRSQAIDHIVADQDLAAVATYDIVHLNTGYNSLGTDPSLSDHDPGLASFDFRAFGETLAGTDGDDSLEGLGGDDVLSGLAGDDTLDGGEGDDRLIGGEGRDTYIGGDGTDTVDFSSETGGKPVVVNLSSNLFVFPAGHAGAGRSVGPNEALDSYTNYESLSGIENVITGGGDDRVIGSDGANRIETGAGNDWLQGGAGADTLIGGEGDDIYEVQDAGDVVIEDSNEGRDEVRTNLANYVLPANVEDLTYFGSAPASLSGNAGDNRLRGGSGGDYFDLRDGGTDAADGFGGNDAFYMGAALSAGDEIDGGAGSDQMGVQGDYAMTLGAGNLIAIESLVLISGADTRFGDPGTNLYSYAFTTVDENVAAGQRLTVTASALLAGENLTFDGSAESDGSFLFYGGQGIETLTGGALADAFFFGSDGRFAATDSVDGGGGNDQVGIRGDYSTQMVFTADTIQNVESLVVISATDQRYGSGGTAFDYNFRSHDGNVASGATLVVTATGLTADESLIWDGSTEQDGRFDLRGGAGDDILVGGAGSDSLCGGRGADMLAGNGGNDVFHYRSVADSTATARDTIVDFRQGDLIDLGVIDADTTEAGNQSFAFIGDAAFSGQAGELRAYETGTANSWMVEADVDGDGIADLVVEVRTVDSDPLTAIDFMM